MIVATHQNVKGRKVDKKITVSRAVLARTIAVLTTARHDKPADLEKPERTRVLEARIAELQAVLDTTRDVS
ncbi:hypothetical protein [Azospirillum argentinense]|uniref:Uncharacterized protein n=1 Tax=Azospirillum brasilense TaxID=192 RepID=A0A4D8QFG7_AZOBR|nr:hypothetical protein [Azospirillum argentinense]QCO07553.1 hypothetical protein D3867_37350 [Azospirillum argentinense]